MHFINVQTMHMSDTSSYEIETEEGATTISPATPVSESNPSENESNGASASENRSQPKPTADETDKDLSQPSVPLSQRITKKVDDFKARLKPIIDNKVSALEASLGVSKGAQLDKITQEEVIEYVTRLATCDSLRKLENKDLSGLDFGRRSLQYVSLRHSRLIGADLSCCYQLTLMQIGGTDLSHAFLPISTEKAIEQQFAYLGELNRKIGAMETILLTSLLVIVLVAYSTDDAAYYANLGAVALPIINIPLSPTSFVFVAPLVPISLFLWIHFHIQQYWKILADLPAIFPDGAPLTRKGTAWLGAGKMEKYFPILRQKPETMQYWGAQTLMIVLYILTPLLVGCVGYRCLILRNPVLSYWHLTLTTLCLVFSYVCYTKASDCALKQNTALLARIKRFFTLGMLTLIILGMTARTHNDLYGWNSTKFPNDWRFPRDINFQGANVSQPKEGWSEPDATEVIPDTTNIPVKASEQRTQQVAAEAQRKQHIALFQVKPAFLDGRNMSGVNGERAFLAGARLRRTYLVKANLIDANFQNAILYQADLRGADLTSANLQYANINSAQIGDSEHSYDTNLDHAKLQFSSGYSVNLSNMSMMYTDCRYATMHNAIVRSSQLDGSDFSYSNLKFATFEDSRSSVASPHSTEITVINGQPGIRHATGLILVPIIMSYEEKTFDTSPKPVNMTGAVLERASFRRANLESAIFNQCDLKQADFGHAHIACSQMIGADLTLASFEGADMEGIVLDEDTIAKNKAIFESEEMRRFYRVVKEDPFRGLIGFDRTIPHYVNPDNLRYLERVERPNFQNQKHPSRDFRRMNLVGALMNWTNLEAVDFQDASLKNAQFIGATITNARNMDTADLDMVIFDENTVWPHGGALNKEKEILRQYAVVELSRYDLILLGSISKYAKSPKN